MTTNTLEQISRATTEQELLAIAFACKGDVTFGEMSSEYYAECMIALSSKLGFTATQDNLEKAAAKYLGNSSQGG